jgi:hypothetical protein
MRAIGLLLLLLLSSAARCEQPIKKPPQANAVDFSLYAGVMTARILDFASTERVLTNGGHELILPKGLVSNKPAFALFSIGTGVAEIFISRMLLRAGHRKLSRYMLAVDIGATGAVAAHNFSIPAPTEVVVTK